jgi:hypothetical protein
METDGGLSCPLTTVPCPNVPPNRPTSPDAADTDPDKPSVCRNVNVLQVFLFVRVVNQLLQGLRLLDFSRNFCNEGKTSEKSEQMRFVVSVWIFSVKFYNRHAAWYTHSTTLLLCTPSFSIVHCDDAPVRSG